MKEAIPKKLEKQPPLILPGEKDLELPSKNEPRIDFLSAIKRDLKKEKKVIEKQETLSEFIPLMVSANDTKITYL